MKYQYCPICTAELSPTLIDNRERLICSKGCGFIHWNNPIPVVGIIVETRDGIVLAHNKSWPDGIYSIITGFFESGETPEHAAIRETKEELGLDVQQAFFIGNFPFARLNQLMMVYHVVAMDGEIILNEELDSFKLFPREALLGWDETQAFDVGRWLMELRVLKTSAALY
jgi:NAD+ diphosphatase